MQVMLNLTFFERLMWIVGVHTLSRREMAHRVFQFIDDNGNGAVADGTLNYLMKMLHGQLQFSKASFDFLQVCC